MSTVPNWQAGDVFDMVIPNGGAEPVNGANLNGKVLTGITLPASIAGATVKFLVATTLSGTYVAMTKDDGTDYTLVPTASKYLPVDPNKFYGVRFLKLQFASNQSADRTVKLHARDPW